MSRTTAGPSTAGTAGPDTAAGPGAPATRATALRTALLRRHRTRSIALVLALALAGVLAVAWWPRQDSVEITAYFPRTVGVYPGSDVRVLGVRVGEIREISPEGERVRVVLTVRADVPLPADAGAAIINSSVVSDRYLQLLPVYRDGPRLRDGDVIPVERTAVPVELDRVYESLHTLSEALGPEGANRDGSLSRLLGVSAENLDGQGEPLHHMVSDLSQAVTTLADGRHDLFGTVRGLQEFTAALAADDASVRAFNESLAEVAAQFAGEREELGSAIGHLAVALTEVAGFVEEHQDAVTENVAGLAEVTRVLVEQRAALAEFMDVAPAGLSNLQNAYNPSAGTLDTRDNPNHQSQDPADLLCSLLTTADPDTDCTELTELFETLPELPYASDRSAPPPPGPRTGTGDRTLGGILEVRS
jgi:phospholipid/cholesterol/gamma-HCH transport system substrate-binding protein